jgi:Bcr/CflA subfamily drug resistance transporter
MNPEIRNIKLTRYDIKVVCLVVLIGAFSAFGIDMHLPSLPFIVKALHTNVHMGQLSITIYLLGMLVMQLFYGPLADKHGRKPIILIGLSVAVIGSVMCAMATRIDFFLAGRLVQGLGAAVGMSLGRSVINDCFSRIKMAAYGSYVSVLIAIAMMVAPVLGGYIQHYASWQVNFLAMGAFFLLGAIVILAFLPETCAQKNPHALKKRHLLGNYWVLLKNPTFMIFNVCSGLALGAIMAYTNISSFLFQLQYHMSPIMYGWLGVILGGASIVGKSLSGIVVRRSTIERGIWVGLSIITLAGVLMFAGHVFHMLSVFVILSLIMLCVIGQGFIFSNASAGALSPFRHIGGVAGALFGCVQYVVAFLTSAIIASLHVHGAAVLSGAYIVLGVIGIFSFYVLMCKERR